MFFETCKKRYIRYFFLFSGIFVIFSFCCFNEIALNRIIDKYCHVNIYRGWWVEGKYDVCS